MSKIILVSITLAEKKRQQKYVFNKNKQIYSYFFFQMVTVAKSFEAPIKLVFPQDLIERGFFAENMAMLGLGDIVIPGIFIALLLRYDKSLKRNSNFYFNVTFIAYILGLLTTIGVMHVFKHAQPALLYLVPACLGKDDFLLKVI